MRRHSFYSALIGLLLGAMDRRTIKSVLITGDDTPIGIPNGRSVTLELGRPARTVPKFKRAWPHRVSIAERGDPFIFAALERAEAKRERRRARNLREAARHAFA